jgi:hypothetical protein
MLCVVWEEANLGSTDEVEEIRLCLSALLLGGRSSSSTVVLYLCSLARFRLFLETAGDLFPLPAPASLLRSFVSLSIRLFSLIQPWEHL